MNTGPADPPRTIVSFFTRSNGSAAILTLSCAALIGLASARANATILTYTLQGPTFTSAAAPFTTAERITGFVSFDSSKLSGAGTGSIATSSTTGIDPGILWSFTDGHNLFNNTNRTTNFPIQMSFNAFLVNLVNIDPTHGTTTSGDIFVESSGTTRLHYESYFLGSFATASPGSNNANWTLSQSTPVPEPSGLLTLGGGLLGLGFIGRQRRRKVH